MARRVTRSEIEAALERRYDHVSARVVFAEALVSAKIGDKSDYTVEELSRLAWVLHSLGERVMPASEALLELATEASSAGQPVFAEEASELDEEPEWERIDAAAIPALLQGIVDAAVRSAKLRSARGEDDEPAN